MRIGWHFGLILAVLVPMAGAGQSQTTPADTPAPTIPAPTIPAPTDLAAPATPIVTLDREKLFSGTMFGKSVTAAIEAEAAVLSAENRKIDTDLEAEERSLTDRRAGMSPEDFRVLADTFDQKVTVLRAAQDEKSRSLAKLRDDERKRFFEASIAILGQLMREIGAFAILSNDAVILSFDRIDITDEAIARMDQVLGDGSSVPKP